MIKSVEVRKLRREEHIRTRKLWEAIFTEDTPEFLDYYHSVKTMDNEIYVIEDGDEIISMIQLNPYQMRIGDKIYQTHYIVGVATDERYRRQGLMAKLLNHVLQVMKDAGEPFTFLMPASEAIYKPFGFEFVYQQKRMRLAGTAENDNIEFVFAEKENCQMIAKYANDFLKKYDVVTWRDSKYYETLLAERKSENGGILIAKRDGKIKGILSYTRDEQYEIYEPLFCDEKTLQTAIYVLTGNETEQVLCVGYGQEEEKPMIMAKILHSEIIGDLKNTKVFLNELV